MRKDVPKPSESISVTSELNTKACVEPLSTSMFVSSSTTAEIADTPKSETEENSTNESLNDEEKFAPKRPPMDLFKAIFADSSTDESEASGGDEDKETERLSIRVSEIKTAQEPANSRRAVEAGNSNGDVKARESNVTDDVLLATNR